MRCHTMPGLTVPCNSQSHCMKIRTTWQIVLWPESSHMGSGGFRLNIQRRTYLKKNWQREGSYGAFHTYTPGFRCENFPTDFSSRTENRNHFQTRFPAQLWSPCYPSHTSPLSPKFWQTLHSSIIWDGWETARSHVSTAITWSSTASYILSQWAHD